MNPRDPYKEPSGVLRNRLGISDPAELAEYERDLAFFRVVELELSPLEGRFDFEHLRAIHRYILQDLFDWGRGHHALRPHGLTDRRPGHPAGFPQVVAASPRIVAPGQDRSRKLRRSSKGSRTTV